MEFFTFLKCAIANPKAVGTIVPSSKNLALQLLKREQKRPSHSIRYLEIGAGSGAITESIVKQLREKDTLDLIELDSKFCDLLRKKFGQFPNVVIHELSVLDFPLHSFDVVISSLPLNAFSATLVDQILVKFKSLVKKGGELSFFEYFGIEKFKSITLKGSSSLDYKEMLQVKHRFLKQYCHLTKKTWFNIPPAKIFHCKL